jgi:uncharacterized protein (UPF0548 family)
VGSSAELSSDALIASLASRYDVDRRRFTLGRGRGLFERARAALLAWRHFEIPWLRFYASGPVASGQTVATLVSVAGVWFLNPCRVVYTDSPAQGSSVAFAYGTLPGHAESGEERFEVAYDPFTEEVVFTLAAFSRPALLLSKLGYPLARRLQQRFAIASSQALAQAAN